MPAIGLDTISGTTCLDGFGHASIQTGGCHVLRGCCFCSYGMEYKKCVDSTWCQYPNPLTLGSLGTCYNVTIPNLDTNTCYQYHAIGCTVSNAYSGTTLSIQTPAPAAPWISTPLVAGPLVNNQYCMTIPGLSASTCYQYRSVFMIGGTCYYGNILDGTTQPAPMSAPSVTTGIAPGAACINGYLTCCHTVDNNGGLTIQEYGILYTANPSYNSNCTLVCTNLPTNVVKASTCGSISVATPYSDTTVGLPPNTTTYYRAFAVNAVGIGYGCIYSKITAPLPTIDVFLEACTDVLDMVIAGAFSLMCCNGSQYATVIIGSPYAEYTCRSCNLTGVPAGCYYVDYSCVQLWCCCTPQHQVSINGVNWSDNTHPGCYDQCCTACFSTNNSVYGCIY
jgi:hypothetical protein